MRKIEMVDLKRQYQNIKNEVDEAMQAVIDSTAFVKGGKVTDFQLHLERYLGVKHVIPVGNGTDALMLSLMALDLKPEDEVIVPSFTFISAAEVVSLLGLKLVLADVDENSFCMTEENIRRVLTNKTRVIIPVHLFGQNADMSAIMCLAKERGIYVVEDACQSIGSKCQMGDGSWQSSGTMGDLGCTSFFPSKNLGCYGDGGAVFTQSDALAEKVRSLANHGMTVRYHHDHIGVNSRLDSLQAAVLDVKLKYLDDYITARRTAADYYFAHLKDISSLVLPMVSSYTTHVWHQYTIRVPDGRRDELQAFLKENGVPSMVYYPIPIHQQKAYHGSSVSHRAFPISERLSDEVLSLPMHTELDEEQLHHIVETIRKFFSDGE
jgi:dTDP-4-amino-4,6-dideoxygalactose transaminase